MQHKVSTDAIRTLLITCHEAKRITELQPPLPEGLTPANLKVLDYIEYLERTAQPPKVSDIAERLQVTRPGITRLVSELEAIHAVEKITDAHDKRIVRLHLQEAGRKLHMRYITQYHSWLAAQLEDVTEADVRTTAATISKLYTLMSARSSELKGNTPLTQEVKRHD